MRREQRLPWGHLGLVLPSRTSYHPGCAANVFTHIFPLSHVLCFLVYFLFDFFFQSVNPGSLFSKPRSPVSRSK